MIFASYRNGWAVKGILAGTIQASKSISAPVMAMVHNMSPDHEQYSALAAPHRYPRAIVLKAPNYIVIIPITPDVVAFEEQPDGLGQRDQNPENASRPSGEADV
jgi:hypothetical protein